MEKVLVTIGRVAEIFGVTTQTIRKPMKEYSDIIAGAQEIYNSTRLPLGDRNQAGYPFSTRFAKYIKVIVDMLGKNARLSIFLVSGLSI